MSRAMVTRDAATFLSLSEDLLNLGYRVRFRVDGTSMQPTIENGDAITIALVAPADVERGDILLYRCGRRTTAHRVVDIHRVGNEIAAFILRGDAKAAFDAPVAPNQILGKVVAVEHVSTWRAKAARWVRAVRGGVRP